MKRIIAMTLCAVMLIATVSCGLTSSDPWMDNSEHTLRIDKESGWTSADGMLNDEADIEIYNPSQTAYLMVIAESKADLDLDFDGYRSVIIDNTKQSYNVDLSNADPEYTKQNGNDFYMYDFDVTQNSVNLHMFLYVCQTENYYAQIYTWTLMSAVDKMSGEMGSMAISLREIKPDEQQPDPDPVG